MCMHMYIYPQLRILRLLCLIFIHALCVNKGLINISSEYFSIKLKILLEFRSSYVLEKKNTRILYSLNCRFFKSLTLLGSKILENLSNLDPTFERWVF